MHIESKEFVLSQKALAASWQELQALKQEQSNLRDAQRRCDFLDKLIPRKEHKYYKAKEYLKMLDRVPANKEAQRIAKILIKAKERDCGIGDKDSSHFIFDKVEPNFCIVDREGRKIYLTLLFNHYRHYDTQVIIGRIEELIKYKVTEWFLMLSTDFTDKSCIELRLTLRKVSGCIGGKG
jgi:hypothetical protein